jgi:hypothetical protein
LSPKCMSVQTATFLNRFIAAIIAHTRGCEQ